MKSTVIFGIIFQFFLISVLSLNAQSPKEALTNSDNEIIYLGIDFSKTAYVGDPGTVSKTEMFTLFEKINNLIINEKEKYDIASALQLDEFKYNLKKVHEINNGIDPESIKMLAPKSNVKMLSQEEVETIVSNYNFGEENQVGVLFIMEYLSKPEEKGFMWITFVDLSNGDLIYTQRMEGEAGGFGFRNHWARTVYEVINYIDKRQYKQWMK